ncbi:MAG: hypothetical protein ACR2PL_05425 [Dehalococcoidia bacterium]
MGNATFAVDIPEELVELLGGYDRTAQRARAAVILDLLRSADIGESLAATLLGPTRWDLVDLMARHQVPSRPERPEETEREL